MENNEIEQGNTKFSYKEEITIINGFYKGYGGTIEGYKTEAEKTIYKIKITSINKDIWLEETAIKKFKKFLIF